VGVAIYPEDGTTRDSLLSAADAVMYVSKHTRKQVAAEIDAGAGHRIPSEKRS
jgi:predicted signal transduction protein with EAL and GGDEF domain